MCLSTALNLNQISFINAWIFVWSEKGIILHEKLVRKRFYFELKWYYKAFGNTALGLLVKTPVSVCHFSRTGEMCALPCGNAGSPSLNIGTVFHLQLGLFEAENNYCQTPSPKLGVGFPFARTRRITPM